MHGRIFFKESKSEYTYQVKIQSNTFYSIKGIHFQSSAGILQPAVADIQRVAVIQNYFFNTTEGILVADDNPAALPFVQNQSSENVRSSTSPDVKTVGCLPATSDIALPIDPKDEKTFLRYDKNSPLFKAANGKPVELLRSNSEAVPSTKSLM